MPTRAPEWHPKPLLTIAQMPYRGSIPLRMRCEVCDVNYRNQGVDTAIRFYKNHRHCGLTKQWSYVNGWHE